MSYIFREHIRQSLAVIAFLIALTACTSEAYDSGDGQNSYLTADLVLLRTFPDKSVRSALLDDDTELLFSNPFAQEWLARPDSVYRALLYYDKTEATTDAAAGNGTTAKTIVRARSVRPVPVLSPVEAAKVDAMRTDPVGFESLWMSKNKSYINLSLLLKSGKAEGDEALHALGVVSDGTTTDAAGSRTLHLTLYHDQGGVPEYYTVQQYVSIPTQLLEEADTVEITLNTYNGKKVVKVAVSNL